MGIKAMVFLVLPAMFRGMCSRSIRRILRQRGLTIDR